MNYLVDKVNNSGICIIDLIRLPRKFVLTPINSITYCLGHSCPITYVQGSPRFIFGYTSSEQVWKKMKTWVKMKLNSFVWCNGFFISMFCKRFSARFPISIYPPNIIRLPPYFFIKNFMNKRNNEIIRNSPSRFRTASYPPDSPCHTCHWIIMNQPMTFF